MLGLARAMLLSSVAFVKQSYAQTVGALKPVSYWHLGEAAGLVIFDEKAVQNGTYEGTLQGTIEYGLGPLVESSIGASAGFDGTHTYGLIPHNSAFELPRYTIDFAFQADTAPPVGQNRVLFSKDLINPAPAGALSIEIYNNTNGQLKLRAYAGGPAGTPIWIGGPGGAADLQLGTAYKVAVTVDPSDGARLYLDGVQVAHEPTATVGWTANNTEPFVLGAYSSSALAKFDGVMDEVALFDQALSASNLLRLAQATTLARPLQLTGGPVVPRMDLWLTNDDQNPATLGSTLRYAAPGATGNGLSPSTPGNLQTLLSAASGGWVIVCAQGYYHLPNGLDFPSGANQANPVTVVAAPGEWAVIAFDDELAQIVEDTENGQNPWTLHDAAKNIWKTTYHGSSGLIDGCFFQYGIPFMLFTYDSLADLSLAVDSASRPTQKSGFWFFSGTYNDAANDTLYIRLDRSNWSDVGFVHSTYGAWPDDNRYHLPIQGNSTSDNPSWFSRANGADFKTGRPTIGQGLNPNNTRIYLTPHTSNTNVINSGSGSFIRVGSGINSMGFANLIRGQAQLEVHRGCHWCWETCIEGGLGNTDVTLHRVRCFTGTHRLLGSMAVMKFNSFLAAPILEFSHRSAAVRISNNLPAMDNVTLNNCTFCGYHEFFEGAGTNVDRFRMVNCSVAFIYDEFSQCSHSNFTRFEIGHCYSVNGCPILLSSVEGESGTQSNMGTIWIHHNVSDDRIGRASFAGSRPIAGSNGNIARSTSEKVAWKYYNNTMISGVDPASGIGSFINPYGSSNIQNVQASAAVYNEVFNNLILAHDVKRFQQQEGGRTGFKIDSCETYPVTGTSGTPNRERRDYNCYWRNTPADPATGNRSREKIFFVDAISGGSPGGNFTYIRANIGGESPGSSVFFGSPAHANTTAVQSGGWDANSTDADPGVPSIDNSFPANRMNYRPQNAAVVSALASGPSGATWWTSPGWTSYGASAVPFNLAPSAWKGALDPNGSTVPIGVQNP